MVPISERDDWKTKHDALNQDLQAARQKINTLVPASERDDWKRKHDALNQDLQAARQKINTLVPASERDNWKTKHDALNKDLQAARQKINTMVPVSERDDWKRKHDALNKKLETPPKPAFDAKHVKNLYGKRIKLDDLKIVEGIGPKIEQLFHNFGIKTWKALSEASVAKCQEVLDSGGER